jgi:hypothetical protein
MSFLCLKLQSQNVGVVRSLPRNKYTLLCAIIVSGIGDVMMLPWQMTCHIGAKNMSVTFKIMTEGVRPQFVELFPRGMTAGIGPVGISVTPMK